MLGPRVGPKIRRIKKGIMPPAMKECNWIFEEKTLAKQPRQHTEGLPIINRLINGQSINECPLIGWLIPIQSPRRSQQHKAHEDHNNSKRTKIDHNNIMPKKGVAGKSEPIV